MAPDPSVFEKLGSFYLGKSADDGSQVLYDSRDLVTHAVCVGMTGSGKTGLCLALLEEAAMDGVPAIIIDPKGDLGNLLLTFPDLRAEDFRPWINEDDARRKGVEPDAWAEKQATTWREGLASWGQSGDRIRELRKRADFSIFTPGSTAGIPVNLLDAFHAPASSDPEELAGQALTAVAGLLGLLGIDADPSRSREGAFLSAVLTTEWQAGRSPDLAALVSKIQQPGFDKVGVLDLEAFFPAKDRFALVLALNNLLASPGFALWRTGEPLDIARFLRAPDGRPRHAIFSIAHLDDAQRMFFVSLLLNEVVSWMRRQSGTTSLRAIVYMDEIFGYFPPVANPPSKLPLLTLLKQARAFGVGVVLATQNPVDLDYKGLANTGTWLIGRLQTDRDKARVIDGLTAAADVSRKDLEAALESLGSRRFLLHNVHGGAPEVFESRWVMSYLRGPLTRDQIRILMKREATATPVAQPAATDFSSGPPAVPPGIPQVFLPSSLPLEARLVGAATVRFSDAKSGTDETRNVLVAAEFPSGPAPVDWSAAEVLTNDLADFSERPPEGASFGPLPSAASKLAGFSAWQKDFVAWLAANERLETYRCAELKLISRAGESLEEFTGRAALARREARDARVEALRKKFAPKRAALETRLARAQATVEKQKEQARHATFQTALSVGTSILGAFLGRKALSAANINRAGSAAKGVSRAMREGSDVGAAVESLESLRAEAARLETEFEAEIAALQTDSGNPEIDTVALKPARGGVQVRLFALGWI
ncbi:MAG: type IV secretion system DNA-binding domain-containing protein [Terrimicrobiaceae bacterium]|nr:type IV secretion system DNA-binding domain-containing protein [Terrimicrobiaceae bacterium]